MPCFAAQTAVAFVAEPHQIRSRRPARKWLEAQEPGRIGKHRARVGLRETFPIEKLEKRLSVAPSHGRIVFAFIEPMTKVTPSIDHLLGRAAADSQLQARASDEIGRTRVFRHVVRILIPHVDDGRSDLDLLGFCANRGEQRKRGGELPREMMNPEVGSIHPESLRLDREVDRLQEHISR